MVKLLSVKFAVWNLTTVLKRQDWLLTKSNRLEMNTSLFEKYVLCEMAPLSSSAYAPSDGGGSASMHGV